MRLYPECVPCMLQRALLFCEGEDEKTRREVLRKLCRLCSELISEDITTTGLAYERNKVIEGVIKNSDPMKDLKKRSFDAAIKLYPKLKGIVDKEKDDSKRFKLALKIALAGNIIEFGAQDHKVDLDKLDEQTSAVINGSLAVDDSDRIYEKIRKSKEILYVTDNAAEIVFDRVLIEELTKYAKVCVCPLSRPVQDDATIEEIKKAGLDRICEVIPRGDFLGLWFEKCTPRFLKKFGEADFIIAKGMGCYETLMDYPEKLTGRIGLLMKAKCVPVAKNINVPLGSAIIKLL
ncbi:MAG: DUF89 family protein [Candidatus Altiarchaeota archaeon]|nr:DUF89 family protein [Candidatus Altiarchaeota archaeon]